MFVRVARAGRLLGFASWAEHDWQSYYDAFKIAGAPSLAVFFFFFFLWGFFFFFVFFLGGGGGGGGGFCGAASRSAFIGVLFGVRQGSFEKSCEKLERSIQVRAARGLHTFHADASADSSEYQGLTMRSSEREQWLRLTFCVSLPFQPSAPWHVAIGAPRSLDPYVSLDAMRAPLFTISTLLLGLVGQVRSRRWRMYFGAFTTRTRGGLDQETHSITIGRLPTTRLV
jgi:hypothetical protein